MITNRETDLVFGKNSEVIVLDGAKDFSQVTRPDDPVQIYFLGTLIGHDPKTLQASSNYADLFGRFVTLIHDIQNQTLTVINDRYGLLPFYYCITPTNIVFSRSLSRFVDNGLANKMDESALSDILALNVPLGEKTLYSGISALSAGKNLQIGLENSSFTVQTQKSWEPAKLLQNANIPLEEVQEQLTELLLEGFEKASSGYAKIGVTLSGGVDSRLLLAAGLYVGRDMETYTTGIQGSRSLTYAKQMADICGVANFAYPLNSEFIQHYGDAVKANIKLTEGMSFSSEAEARWLRNKVPKDRVMMHGAFAELYKIGHMHNFYFQNSLMHLGQHSVAETVWQRFADRYNNRKQIFAESLRHNLGDQARTNLISAIEAYPKNLKASGWLQNLYIDQFLNKVTRSSAEVWNEHLPTYFPFSYPPFIDLLLQVRATDKVDFRFPQYFLQKTNPKLANFPDSNTGTKIGASKAFIELVHIYDGIFHRIFGSKTRYDHMDVTTWLQNMEPPIAKRISDLRNDDIFDHQEAQKLVNTLSTNRSNQTSDSLLILLMSDMWLSNQKGFCSTSAC